MHRLWMEDQALYSELRARISEGDPAPLADAEFLRALAEPLRDAPAPAVTDQTSAPYSPTDDPQDYVSIGSYWWPNPDTPDHLPYVRRDGEQSPDIDDYDRPAWDRTASSTVTLAMAAYFLEDNAFAEAAARYLRRWFIEPETRMNPHLRYAQLIPGKNNGRAIGIIDFAVRLPQLLDHVALLPDASWTETDQAALATWCGELLDWCDSHPFGAEEEAKTNNHGTYYDRQIVALALFLDRPDRARRQLKRAAERVGAQIEPDGSMPHELGRTRSLTYSAMNLRGFVDLAWADAALGGDLWSLRTPDGRCIRAAADHLWRHAASHEDWPWEQITPFQWTGLCSLYHKIRVLAGGGYPIDEIAHRLPAGYAAHPLADVNVVRPLGHG